MLNSARLVGFVATSQPEKSKHFYGELLGLQLIEERPYAIVFEANSTVIRIQKVQQVCAPPYTAMGWEVQRIEQTVKTLSDNGVLFERFDGLQQDELAIWHVPGGASVAWFKDPDGNLLSVTQLPA
jgi:catechol 2,3-dioxygenase-like lactoylglutathione lyase family enzyme